MEFRKITALKTQNGPKPRDAQADDKFQGKLLYPTAPAESSLNAFPSSPPPPPSSSVDQEWETTLLILFLTPAGMVSYSDR